MAQTIPGQSGREFFELRLEVVDPTTFKVVMMNHHEMDVYRAMGIPEALIELAAYQLGKRVVSSSNNPGFHSSHGERRTLAATKVWERLIARGLASYSSMADMYSWDERNPCRPFVTQQPIKIDYESERFPPRSGVANGYATLNTSWDELLWAAVTIGRPNRNFVFRHGLYSQFEALFRWSLVRMALQQRSTGQNRLSLTDAAKTLDPSEKGAVNYFLGMTLCKLFASRLLRAPWMMHLDVFRPQLNAVLRGRSRPDLVGQTNSGDWVAIESKGRLGCPGVALKHGAKLQAQRVIQISGVRPSFHIGGITYFRGDTIHYFWRDPEPTPGKGPKPIDFEMNEESWRYYYQPVYELISSRQDHLQRMTKDPHFTPIEVADIHISIHPQVLRLLIEGHWGPAKGYCVEHGEELEHLGYQADGVRVVAGTSWLLPFDDCGDPIK
jgi:hypothetical protein